METESGFTTEGKEKTCPDFHRDRLALGGIATWGTERILTKLTEYEDYLRQERNLAHQIEKANKMIGQYLFELVSRDAFTNDGKNLDEVCEGV